MNNLKFNVQMIGYLENNPTITRFNNGRKMANLSLVTLEVTKQDGHLIKTTKTHNAVAWNEIAELVEKNLKKGSEIMFEGYFVNLSAKNSDNIQKLSKIIISNFMYRNTRKSVEKNIA